MKGNGNTSNSMFGNMMPFMMMGGSGMDMFDGLFDFDDVDMALPMVDTDNDDDNDDNTEDNE
jgi:hypothetical protein